MWNVAQNGMYTRHEWEDNELYRNSVFKRYPLKGVRRAHRVLHQALGPRHVLGRAPVLLQGSPGVPNAPALLHLSGTVPFHR